MRIGQPSRQPVRQSSSEFQSQRRKREATLYRGRGGGRLKFCLRASF